MAEQDEAPIVSIAKGDLPGHEFRGNQYSESGGGGESGGSNERFAVGTPERAWSDAFDVTEKIPSGSHAQESRSAWRQAIRNSVDPEHMSPKATAALGEAVDILRRDPKDPAEAQRDLDRLHTLSGKIFRQQAAGNIRVAYGRDISRIKDLLGTKPTSGKLGIPYGMYDIGKQAEPSIRFNVLKQSADEQRMVYGIAQYSARPDGSLITDAQGDQVEPDELEKAFHSYALNSRQGDVQHNRDGSAADLVELMVVTPEKLSALMKGLGCDVDVSAYKGAAAWVGFHVNDDAAWEGVKKGKYRGFSIDAVARREEV